MAAYVYILKDLHNKYYIGSTNNLSRRLQQHRAGHTQTTRNMSAPKLVFQQAFTILQKARQTEKRIKSWKRKDFIEKIIQDGYIKNT